MVGGKDYYHPPKCPYCGATSKMVDDTIIYGRHYGYVYLCANYPRCDAFVGVHKDSNRPKGLLANGELREARKMAHACFDPLWKSGVMKRKDAYKWLADGLKIHVGKCHIGMFDLEQCKKVIEIMNLLLVEAEKKRDKILAECW